MEQVKQFGIQWPLLVASVINFFILLYLLKRFLYKPILKMLDARKDIIAKSLENAEKIEKDKQQMEDRLKASLRLANEEAMKIISQAHKVAEKSKEEILALAQVQSEKIILRTKEEIAQEREKTSQALRKETAVLVTSALRKIASENKLVDEDKLVAKAVESAVESIDG